MLFFCNCFTSPRQLCFAGDDIEQAAEKTHTQEIASPILVPLVWEKRFYINFLKWRAVIIIDFIFLVCNLHTESA